MKKLPVYWNGVKLCDIYPHATKFQVFKYKAMKLFTNLLKLLLTSGVTVGVVYLAFFIGQSTNPKVAVADTVNVFEQKLETLKTQVVNDIAYCESRNSKTEDGLIVMDDNRSKTLPKKDKVSIGPLQFKISTVQRYQKELYQKDVTNHEAILIALDKDKAHMFAKDIIFKTTGGVYNWTCATKDIVERVKIIKELEK